jgi:Relaxase/Mobilisation nuclease domain
MANQNIEVGRAWDDNFYGWADDLQLGRKFKKPAASARGGTRASMWTGAPVKSSAPVDYAGRGSKADVRSRLSGIARGSKQVMVKITPGKNRSMHTVREHMKYIAREGEETLLDQDGREINGLEAVKELSWAWQHGGPLTPSEAEHKLAFNIVFSMPEGTDQRAVYAAVRATAEAEFEGKQWVMVQHFDEPQVHCHICVKAEGFDGVRLNPRKADLQRWRERFAHELRERGVEAEATSRATRLHQQKINKPWAVTRLEERGVETKPLPVERNKTRVAKWQQTAELATSSYAKVIEALGRSDEAVDRVLAKELETNIAARSQAQGRLMEKSKTETKTRTVEIER